MTEGFSKSQSPFQSIITVLTFIVLSISVYITGHYAELTYDFNEKIRHESYEPCIDIGRPVKTELGNIRIFLRNIGNGAARNIDVVVYNPENDKEEYRNLASEFFLDEIEYVNEKPALYHNSLNVGEERSVLIRVDSSPLFEEYRKNDKLYYFYPVCFLVTVFYEDKDGREYEDIKKLNLSRESSGLSKNRRNRFVELKNVYIMNDKKLENHLQQFREFINIKEESKEQEKK